MPASIVDVWPDVLTAIGEDIGKARFDLWFRDTCIQHCSDSHVEIGTPNLFVASWLETHFKDAVARAFARQLGHELEVKFVASRELFQEARQKQDEAIAELVQEGGAATGAPSLQTPTPVTHVRQDYTFGNFVTGPCNRLAYACAQEVAAHAEAKFNPLFLHSSCGMGKTHLLQGIWHAIRAANDGRTAEYVTAEVFTNEFTYAMRQGRLDAFRKKYRRVDVLLIDDVHFFNNKAGLQEEFLHTFDALDTAQKQIVLASDAHPNSMRALRKGLVSRFVSGMVVAMGKPSLETRFEIVQRLAARLRRTVDKDVVEYIANRFQDNIRELHGAVYTALAFAALAGGKLDLTMAREVFASHPNAEGAPPSIETIETAVATEFGLGVKDLHTRRRTRAIAVPRQVCMYLGRQLTRLSCLDIARHFGSRHHTTVLFAEKSVIERMAADPDFRRHVEAVKGQVQQGN